MAVRFIDTERWKEDWYCELKGEYQKLFDYICDQCDNAGVWKPNKVDFEIKTGFSVNLGSFLKKVNGDKERILLLDNGRWFILGFISFQWFNKKEQFSLILTNRLHKSIYDLLNKHNVPIEKVRGLQEVLEGSTQTSKDKDKGLSNNTGGVGDFSTDNSFAMKPKHAPQFQQVHEFFVRQGKTEREAKTFYDHYEGLGWMSGITPIINWTAFASKWIANPLPQKQAKQTEQDSHLPNAEDVLRKIEERKRKSA
jgi:hypothetical protein